MSDDSKFREPDVMDAHWLSLELCKSIRDIDTRLDELKIILGGIKNERRKHIVERVERLIETRFCLIYSLMDVNPGMRPLNEDSTNPFDNIHITYDMVKRQIK